MPRKRRHGPRAKLPRPCPVQPGFPEDDSDDDLCSVGTCDKSDLYEFGIEVKPGLLPAPIREEDAPGPDEPVIAPYADFLHFSQVPEVPRKLADKQEIRSQPWPLPAPEEMSDRQPSATKSTSIPAVFFAKRHRITVFNYSDLLQTDGCGDPLDDDDVVSRFTNLSSKVDYCVRVKNSYQMTNEVTNDSNQVFKDGPPRICAACSVKTKACLLPDLRHKYRFTFFHTIHVYAPAGVEVLTRISLDDKSKIEPMSVMKICPTGRKTEGLKPEIVTLLQVTHFLRVDTSVMPDISPAMLPRPLPPEFREPQLIIIDEDLHGRPPPPSQPEPEPEPDPSQYPHRPSRSEPPAAEEEEAPPETS